MPCGRALRFVFRFLCRRNLLGRFLVSECLENARMCRSKFLNCEFQLIFAFISKLVSLTKLEAYKFELKRSRF